MIFDSVAMVDWSGGNDRGPRPKADAIWACHGDRDGIRPPVYLRSRAAARVWLHDLVAAELGAGRRLLLGFDFPFGYPAGFARAVTGSDDPRALWQWFAAAFEDGPEGNNRFDLAGQLNRLFPGIGPFWGNGLGRDIPDLPRKGNDRDFRWTPARRQAEMRAQGSFECWQMSGAGSVGGQAMTGLPVLASLAAAFAPHVAVWPFAPANHAPVLLAEIWPSLIAPAIAARRRPGEVKDAAQVRVLTAALLGLNHAELTALLTPPALPEVAREGWILGLGHEARLALAAGPANA